MANPLFTLRWKALFQAANPRRSLAAGALWLITILSIIFSIVAALWVGGIARDNVLEQHARRLALETDQMSSDLSQAITARISALRVIEGAGGRVSAERQLSAAFDELSSAYPQFDWILAADAAGTVVRSKTPSLVRTNVAAHAWFDLALRSPRLGYIQEAEEDGVNRDTPVRPGVAVLGDLAVPFKGLDGSVIGVLVARLTWQRPPHPIERLTDEVNPQFAAESLLLDQNGIIVAGAAKRRGKRWDGVPMSSNAPLALTVGAVNHAPFEPHFERLPDRQRMLVARSPVATGEMFPSGGVVVQLSEPNDRVYQRANAVARRIFWVSISLGVLTAMFGAVGAHRLTRKLKRLAHSVASVEGNVGYRIEVPRGIDEVAHLGRAFATVLGDLQRERAELQTLSRELERRVAVRTREVERLADETRYAAVARERLRMARDLHDTLAHSMMALLSEIRLLRRLQTHDAAAVPAELARAEQVAHDGLKEVRDAITQMRVTTVRDTGLGPALNTLFQRFIDRTGLMGDFSVDEDAARFGDERAETLIQMTQEVLRNIERHAMATRVVASLRIAEGAELVLRIEDNGIGFEPAVDCPGHYGIVGLREQANLIGAQLQLVSRHDAGTSFCVSLRISPIAFGAAADSGPPVLEAYPG